MSDPKTLLALVGVANFITQALVEAGGEITPELEGTMADLQLQVATKVDGYLAVMDRMEIEAEYWKSKADAYRKIAAAHTSVRERLKENIKRAMLAMGVTEVEGHETRFVLSATKPALVITDGAFIPEAYLDTVVEKVPNKIRIREALEHDQSVPGARLEGGHALRSYLRKVNK